jgi:multidrug efflux pump subunit AcrB
MWIVRLALRRPYTFVVFSVLMLLFGIATSIESPKDIYPYIDIPVVTIVWSYSGLPPRSTTSNILSLRATRGWQ